MIMSTYKKICITNRKLVTGDFLDQIRKVVQTDVNMVILREKDLPEQAYENLASKVQKICEEEYVTLVIHTYDKVAAKLRCPNLHVTMDQFRSMSADKRSSFPKLGVSVHSVEEAVEAAKGGASYVVAGHVFLTDCKKGVEPRGLDFIKTVTDAVNIPVYALGGITEENMDSCIEAGASGICMMSGYMKK